MATNTREFHEAQASYYQGWAQAYADQARIDRERGDTFRPDGRDLSKDTHYANASFCQEASRFNAEKARLHLWAALEMAAA